MVICTKLSHTLRYKSKAIDIASLVPVGWGGKGGGMWLINAENVERD